MKSYPCLVAALLLHLLPAAMAAPGSLDSGFTFPSLSPANAGVSIAVPQADGKVLIAGGFTNVGAPIRNYLARLNADGTLDTSFNAQVDGPTAPFIGAVTVQPDGKILIGGRFATVGGVARTNFARLNADGTLDTGFDVAVNDFVRSIMLEPDGQIVIGGNFSNVAGTTRQKVARLDSDGTLDAGFNPNVSSFGLVYGLALQPDGRILICGNFITVGGVSRTHIARVESTGALDTGFNPNLTDPPNPTVYGVAVQNDGDILIGGNFTTIGGTARNYMARLNGDGSLDPDYNPNVRPNVGSGFVYTVLLQADGKAVIGGGFETVSGQTRRCVARINTDGTPDAGFIVNTNATVSTIALQGDGRLLVGGSFSTVNSVTTPKLVRVLNGRAIRSLVEEGGITARWLRGGTAPEMRQVSFELSTDGGTNWSPLGAGTRVAGNWELTGLSLPGSGMLRARGLSYGGLGGGSGGVIEEVAEFPDLVAEEPTLFAPIGLTSSTVFVDYNLPEEAQPGSVELAFDDGTTVRTLTISDEEGGAGMHSFFFDPANPSSEPEINSGMSLPDGTYDVTLSYRDASGNAEVSATGQTTIDTIALTPQLDSPASNSTVGSSIPVTFTLSEGASSVTLTFDDGVTARVLTLTGVGTPTTHIFSFDPEDPVAAAEISSGQVIPDGTYTVRLRYLDGAGNAGDAIATNVRVLTVAPEPEVVLATDAGATGAGLPAGSTFASFSAPDVGVFGGRVSTPTRQRLDAVFDETGTVLLRGQQMVTVDPAGGGDMGMIAKLDAPTGDAVLATLDRRSGATAENDEVLFGGLMNGTPMPLARKGQEVPGLPGVKLKSFLTLDGNGDTAFFSGKLAGAGVNGSSDTAIFAASPATGFKMMVRKGDMVGGKKVKIIATLVGTAGTLAEGRWRGGPDSIGVRLTFTDRTHALYLMRATDAGPADWLLLGQTDGDAGPDLPGAKLLSLNLPAYAPDAMIFDSLLKIGVGGVTKKDNGAIFDAMGVDTRGPISLRLLAQRARPVPAEPTTAMQRFTATLAGLGRASTFLGQTTRTGTRGVAPAIYDARDDGSHRLLARVGDPAPGGGRWNRFTSVAKPDGQGYGALVAALLKVSRADGVTPATRAALYGVDSTGQMRRLLRAGDSIESAGPGSPQKPVKSFVALGAASGSIGAARGYDDQGRVSVLVTFADRTQAVVRIQVP